MIPITNNRLHLLSKEFHKIDAEPIYLMGCGDTSGLELANAIDEIIEWRTKHPEEADARWNQSIKEYISPSQS